MASKTAKAKVQLPSGFKAIQGGGDFAPSWDWKKHPVIEGIMQGIRAVKLPKKGKIPAREVHVYTIRTKDGDVGVWESAGLRALNQVKKGKQVAIAYLGQKRIKGRPQPMRDFVVGVK